MSRKDHGQSCISGAANRTAQVERWVRGRAIYRQYVLDKRDAQMRRLTGAPVGNRAGLLGWLYDRLLRIVAIVSPTSRRLEREKRVAQEQRHTAWMRSQTNPMSHQRRRVFNRKAS
jgi:hypothetical protein